MAGYRDWNDQRKRIQRSPKKKNSEISRKLEELLLKTTLKNVEV